MKLNIYLIINLLLSIILLILAITHVEYIRTIFYVLDYISIGILFIGSIIGSIFEKPLGYIGLGVSVIMSFIITYLQLVN